MRSITSFIVAAATVVALVHSPLLASEGDPFTQRMHVQSACVPDSLCLLNEIANDRIQRALDEVNRHSRGCDRQRLEKTVLKFLGNATIAGVEMPIGPQEFEINRGKAKYLREGLKKREIPSVTIDKPASIYRDLTFRESPGTAFSIGALVKVDGLVISSDKFTHFFAQGYDYIEVYREQRDLMAAYRWGVESERAKKGLEGTGVMSYGDLAANHAGFQFWLQLTEPEVGHFAWCQGRWVQTRCFRWEEHITPAWDEGINVPCYKQGAIARKIQARINQLVRCGRLDHSPPLDRHRLGEIVAAEDPAILPWILNPVTLQLVLESEDSSQTVVEDVGDSLQ